MNGDLEHSGVIREIDGNNIVVSVAAGGACADCKVGSICGRDGDDTRLLDVYEQYPQFYSVGERVVVSVTRAMGMKAVTWSYIVPFFITFATLMGLLELGAGEAVSGLGALGVLAVYYIFLYLLRDRIEKEIIFKIRKT